MIPPLPPQILTQIISHLLPPTLPLPHHLLSKSLIQRLIYLPPDEDDRDGFINSLPAFGIATELDRLAAVGFEIYHQGGANGVIPGVTSKSGVEYASDGESVFARIRVHGIGEVESSSGLEIKFIYQMDEDREPGKTNPDNDGSVPSSGNERGRWTYLSCLSTVTSLQWTSDPDLIDLPQISHPTQDQLEATSSSELPSSMDQDIRPTEQGYYAAPDSMTQENTAPSDYWADFSPPPSDQFNLDDEGRGGAGGGEDDYWAQYDRAFTPSGDGTQTPAESHIYESVDQKENFPVDQVVVKPSENMLPSTSKMEESNQLNNHQNQSPKLPPTPPSPSSSIETLSGTKNLTNSNNDGDLLRSRLTMKISSILRRTWLEYSTPNPLNQYHDEGERELKALRWLSLGRERNPSPKSHEIGATFGYGNSYNSGNDIEDALKAKLSVLREMHDVIGETEENSVGEDGFYRLVEGAMRGPGDNSTGGENGVKRVDSTAQLEYWE